MYIPQKYVALYGISFNTLLFFRFPNVKDVKFVKTKKCDQKAYAYGGGVDRNWIKSCNKIKP